MYWHSLHVRDKWYSVVWNRPWHLHHVRCDGYPPVPLVPAPWHHFSNACTVLLQAHCCVCASCCVTWLWSGCCVTWAAEAPAGKSWDAGSAGTPAVLAPCPAAAAPPPASSPTEEATSPTTTPQLQRNSRSHASWPFSASHSWSVGCRKWYVNGPSARKWLSLILLLVYEIYVA